MKYSCFAGDAKKPIFLDSLIIHLINSHAIDYKNDWIKHYFNSNVTETKKHTHFLRFIMYVSLYDWNAFFAWI